MDQPSHLGRYQIARVLGRGAMGLVYEGLDPRLGRRVAIKVISTSHLGDATVHREYSARFVNEAQAVARLNHPHIVTVHDFGEEDGVTTRREFGMMLDRFFGDGDPGLLLPEARREQLIDAVTGLVAGSARHGLSNLRIETAPGEREGKIRFTVSGTLKLT